MTRPVIMKIELLLLIEIFPKKEVILESLSSLIFTIIFRHEV